MLIEPEIARLRTSMMILWGMGGDISGVSPLMVDLVEGVMNMSAGVEVEAVRQKI